MNRFWNLVVAFAFFSPGLFAENNPNATADDFSRELMRFSGNIHQFNEIYPQEKVFLEFDNTAYFQGEAIWFKAFVTHATTLKRAPSKVLYVDLLSPTGQLIEQQKLKVIGGQCDGAFVLQDISTEQARALRGVAVYPSGFYEIRAYTQNMLDFSKEAIFSRVIPVYALPKYKGEYEKGTAPTRMDVNPLTPNIREIVHEGDKKVNVSFFPEGGDLIAGIPCNVAFKVTGDDGYMLDGVLIHNDGADTTSTIHDGMGAFTLIPRGRDVVQFITNDGIRVKLNLPQALKTGYSMIASATSDTLFQVDIHRTLDQGAQHIGMAVTCRGDLVHFQEIKKCPADTTFNIDCSGWPLGVCRMTLYDRKGKILSSRSLFHNNEKFRSPSISISTDSLSRQPFSKEVINLKLTDKDGNPFRDRFCVSVRDAADFGSEQTDNLLTNLLLSSDLKGYIHDPAWYLAKNDDEHRTALNLLTLVQGWERYEWQYMTGQKYFSEKHRIEDSLTFNGWVLSYFKREPVSRINVTASVMPEHDRTLFETFEYHTDTTGYFGFNVSDFYGKGKISLNLTSKNRFTGNTVYKKKNRIRLERADRPAPRALSKQETDLTHKKAVIEKTKTDFTDDGLPLEIKQNLGILLDDVDIEEKLLYVDYFSFTSFDSGQETELELDMGEYSSFVENYLIEKGFDFMGDGLEYNGYGIKYYVHDNTKAYARDFGPYGNPARIDMIDVKSILIYDEPLKMYQIRNLCPLLNAYHYTRMDDGWFAPFEYKENGDILDAIILNMKYYLVDIQIKENYERILQKDIYNLGRRTTTIQGFSKPVEFYAPQYPEGPISGDPDIRRTIYWNPNVITDKDGNARLEFYNNSFTQRYTISGAGITSSGIPYTLKQNW